jgi:hypothetical protein
LAVLILVPSIECVMMLPSVAWQNRITVEAAGNKRQSPSLQAGAHNAYALGLGGMGRGERQQLQPARMPDAFRHLDWA